MDEQIQQAKSGGDAVLAELDRQIAELYARREREAKETASALATLEAQKRGLAEGDARARQGISQVIQALVGLLAFLGVPERDQPSR